MDKESDRMYRHIETCLQNNGISPAQARHGKSFGALLVAGAWPRKVRLPGVWEGGQALSG